ncbi:subtilase-type protease inhibitor [Streptomyces sp. NPDC097619]|uniref:subtilase-type protease inhibitor n=1 Tax=Streptomyces sp. NPDC097619 TaxID=3157228 RepID=UPI0033207F4B
MRFIARSLGAVAAAAALTALATAGGLTGTAGAAPAGTASLYSPSALVLSVTAGEDPAEGTVLRAVTLSCAPTPGGTHPDPQAACAELLATGAGLDTITAQGSEAPCTREWDPVTVTADGVWQGRRLAYSHTFGNRCTHANGSGSVFSF